jgi:Tol biopolymer transport system component
VKQITFFSSGWAETPHWSPDGSLLAFNTVLNGRMGVQIADIQSGEIWPLMTESSCCPAWMRK